MLGSSKVEYCQAYLVGKAQTEYTLHGLSAVKHSFVFGRARLVHILLGSSKSITLKLIFSAEHRQNLSCMVRARSKMFCLGKAYPKTFFFLMSTVEAFIFVRVRLE